MIKENSEVEFIGKDSYFKGKIVSIFKKLDGVSVRCVVQDERGLLLIKNPKDAILVPPPVVEKQLKINFDERN